MKSLAPLLLLLLMTACASNPPMFSFAEEKSSGRSWMIVNDGVMGGLSTAQMTFTDAGTAYWTGNISLENNGGFSSIRSPKSLYELGKYKGIKVRMKTDGRDYGVTLSTARRFNGISYTHYFPTQKDEWTEVEIPFDLFVGKMFGTALPQIPELDPDAIREVGIILYDKQSGPFQVEVDYVDVY